jgi:hypothetical protein
VADAPRSVSVENMMIGRVEPPRRSVRTASMPSITGISMSIVTRSGASCSTLVWAICPLAAVPTTSIAESAARASDTRRRTTTESSTTSTRIRDTPISSPSGAGQVPASRCPSAGLGDL